MCRWYLLVALALGCSLATRTLAQPTCSKPSSTYDLIQRGVFDQHSCNLSYCHGEARQAGIDLRAGKSYESLLGEELGESGPEHEEEIVKPGDPDHSVLWLSLAAKTLGLRGAIQVAAMGLVGLPVSQDQLEGIRLWILAGAPENGFVEGVDNLIDACPPPSQEDDSNLPACDPQDSSLLLPDLTCDAPSDVRVLYYGTHRILQFSTGLRNAGRGPLIIQAATPATQPGQTIEAVQVILRQDGSKCLRPAGAITYDPNKYWAYTDAVDFELRKDDPVHGELVLRSSKTSYCLLDTDPIRQSLSAPHQFEAHCTDTIGRMGVSSGYKDVYNRVVPGQWIDLDKDPNVVVEPGTYYLLNIANPNGTLAESNASPVQNMSYSRVTIRLPDLVAAVDPTPMPGRRPPHAHPTRPAHGTAHHPQSPHHPHRPSTPDAVPTRVPPHSHRVSPLPRLQAGANQ